MVPADSGRVSRARPYSGTGPRSLRSAYGTLARSGALFQKASAHACCISDGAGPTTPASVRRGFRLVPVRSPLLRESRLISLPPGTEMFQFPGSVRVFRDRRSLGSSPGHFAAFHARLLMTPRHPPRALKGLTTPARSPGVNRDLGRRERVRARHSLTLAAARRLATESRPCSG